MSSFTTKYRLKRPDGTDPFLRSDFVDNWNLLDAAPGLHICTSGSRPTWSGAQNGRLIQETDTQRILEWNGTDFVEPLLAPVMYPLSVGPSAVLSPNAVGNYTIGTVTLKRDAVLLVVMALTVGSLNVSRQTSNNDLLIDGVVRNIGGYQGSYVWEGGAGGSGFVNYVPVTMYASQAVTAGSHTISWRSTVGNGSPTVSILRAHGYALLTAPPTA